MPQRARIAASDLNIPEPDKVNEVMAKLDPSGASDFTIELLEAMHEAGNTGDWSKVQYVVDAWWVSSLFCAHPDIEKALDAAANPGDADQLTVRQVGELLGVG